uniref:Ovostatin n=1 Tax=Castor canadensis TaxID=51338 RepID=A0A8C0WT96_CASCN
MFFVHFHLSYCSFCGFLQYILWVSSVMHSFSTEKACLHLLNLNESVSLSVVLDYDESNTIIFDKSVEEESFYGCTTIKVPQKSSKELGFVTLLAKGATLKFYEKRSVAIVSEENVTFVQTDKPIYKPGDPQHNVIFQWQNVTSFRNITQLSFQLTSEPIFGDYTIVVKSKSRMTQTHQFTVNRNVLPKFEVKVNLNVCAKYTYGQFVQGKAQIRVCRKFFALLNCAKDNNEICEQFIVQLKNGCVSHIVNTKVFQLYRSGFFMMFHVNVVVTEFGTGVQISKKTSIFITSLLGSVSFKNVDPFYRRGISYFGTLKFRGPNNVPMVSKLLQLEQNDKFVGNYTTDENGEAQFSIDTSDIFDPQFNLKATYVQPPSCYLPSWLTPEYSDAHLSVSRFYSRTNSFLKIVPESKQLTCNQQKIITVLFSLNSEAYKGDSNVNFFYLVRSHIYAQITLDSWNGNFSFPITISADLAPLAVVLVYTIHPSGEIVADRVKFQIEKCFKNKVSIKFSKEQALPGSNSNLYLQAAPDSSCALRAVDQSVLLLKPEQELSAESVYNQLPSTRLYGYFYHGLNLDGSKVQPCIPQKNMFHDGLYYMPISNNEDGDIYDIVKDIDLKVITNLHYRKPEVCTVKTDLPLIRPQLYLHPRRYKGRQALCERRVNYVEQTIKETVRTNFPETWIWDLVSIDSSGSANLSFRIPDTITQWKAKAFCVNGDSGFGISSTVSLPVSQSFFVEIASPFSVVRNEQCDLIVNVFSYLNTCVEISVQLGASQNYEANIYTLKNNGSEVLKAGERKTFVWTIIPKTLGKANITVVAESKQSSTCPNEATEEQTLNWKDTVVKDLLVEPEGIKRETTQSFLICTKVSKQVVLDLPDEVVEGSARAFFTVVGDILGVAMQNLENLLQMPYGCGEQNIALLASDTYILDYLRTTGQLTEEIKNKAVFLLSTGYQKILSLKNSDGSYRMLWQKNQKGSIWLSALSFKTLNRMKKYVFVEEAVQKQTLIWLASQQDRDGCFRNNGKIFTNAWEDGDEKNIVLTAFTVGALLEAGLNYTFPVLRNGVFCLEEAVERGVMNGYTHAILAYTFALAGKEEQVESSLQILDQSAIKINNMIYWKRERKLKQDEPPSFIPWALSGETEKTCYVLLAVISRKTQDLAYASRIVQWLAQQTNSHGGFSATQVIDRNLTVIALCALTFSNDHNNITFRSEESSQIFEINRDNRLLVQRSELAKAHGEYTVDVEGQGCVFIQGILRYNVPLPKKASGFSLSLEIVKSSSDIFQTNFDLTVTLKYTGIHENSNMVIVDVKMLSGFTPVLSSIEKLEKNGQVMKTDVKNDHVLFYLENVSDIATNFTFSVEQSNLVSNIQPAPVMVYNYYEKGR